MILKVRYQLLSTSVSLASLNRGKFKKADYYYFLAITTCLENEFGIAVINLEFIEAILRKRKLCFYV
jgi:hypothetical protein